MDGAEGEEDSDLALPAKPKVVCPREVRIINTRLHAFQATSSALDLLIQKYLCLSFLFSPSVKSVQREFTRY